MGSSISNTCLCVGNGKSDLWMAAILLIIGISEIALLIFTEINQKAHLIAQNNLEGVIFLALSSFFFLCCAITIIKKSFEKRNSVY